MVPVAAHRPPNRGTAGGIRRRLRLRRHGTRGCFTVAPREQVVQEVELLLDHMDIVMIHHDHNERGKIDSVRERLGHAADRIVGIVPVRETEAWMLADHTTLPAGPASVVQGLCPVASGGREGHESEEGPG
jgi:hypothetical protein